MAFGSPQWMYKSGEAYELEQSLKSSRAGPNNLSRTPATGGNRKEWTFSCWVKRSQVSGNTEAIFSVPSDYIVFNSASQINWAFNTESDGNLVTTQVFRDASSWMHLLFVHDTTQATASNRAKIYVNGTRITAFATETYPAQNRDGNFNHTNEHNLIEYQAYNQHGLEGYITEVNFLDGVVGTPADFGETGDYGEWKPIAYSGSYGTNGFYLPFKQDYSVEGFSTVLYKGTGASQYIGGTGFKPDLVWNKRRDSAAWHLLSNSIVRHELYPNDSAAEGDAAPNVNIGAYAPDGFVVGTGGAINTSGASMVAWSWDMGADTPTGFGCVAYEGSGSALNITGMGFKPDLTWIKNRDTTDWHQLTDSVRGVDKQIFPNATDAGDNATNKITSFDPDGFSLGSHESVNTNAEEYVAWGWDMGGTSVANTTGDINTTVMANPTYGQSIVAWTGTGSGSSPTVGHGLSSAPEMVIVKHTDAVGAWVAQHEYDTTKYFQMQDVDAAATGATVFDNTAPTSSVFTINATNAVTNQSGGDYIAYCFHSVAGYSKISSYVGNGSSTGPTVTLGFRPAMVILKPTNLDHWNMYDSTRDPLNPTDSLLFVNRTNAEGTGQEIEITDTGFQLKTNNTGSNGNGVTYIYMAFAGGMDSISDYNDTGSIDSRVKANTTYGQSIVSYTGTGTAGATVGHGLSSVPEMIIVKRRSSSQSWFVYHKDFGTLGHWQAKLNTTDAPFDDAGAWNDTAPSNSLITFGNSGATNQSSGTFIAYCFHSVTGYSKFGSYTGDATTNGSLSVTTGFAPAFLMVKRTNSTGGWVMVDNTRNPSNPINKYSQANTNDTEASSSLFNFTSTGFNLLANLADINSNGGTYIYMAFADKREYAYWLDQSGNNNDWTSNNLTESDISVDSPTNNFATYNPLHAPSTGTFSEGNLKHAAGGQVPNISSMAMSSGKWYAEFYCVSGSYTRVGIANESSTGIYGGNLGGTSGSWAKINNTPRLYHNNAGGSYGEDWDAGDICMVAFDADAGKIWYGVNGVWDESGNPATAANPSQSSVTGTDFFFATTSGSGTLTYVVNFGQDSSFAGNKTAQGNQDGNDIGDFYYTPPTGFLALCTKNLPDVAVVPSEHFNTVLYTGTGSSNAISVGFQPDLVWLKMRTQAYDHNVYDSVRGATKYLYTNATDAQATNSERLKTFDSNGFTVGTQHAVNENTYPFVAWNWKAGTSVSGNSSGSGTAQSYTGSVNTDAGFSIIKYTGNGTDGMQVPHHLGVVPDAIFIKSLTTQSWNCFFPNALGADKGLQLDNTGAQGGPFYSTHLSDDMPTTSVVKLGNGAMTNTFADGVGQDYIMYCWANKDGYSKAGKYTGNGSTDGTFVYTGFRPAFVMIKTNTASGEWVMFDDQRDIDNVAHNALRANNTATESNVINDNEIDMLSNGFKARGNGGWTNTNGRGFIYFAFAETPFKYSNAR